MINNCTICAEIEGNKDNNLCYAVFNKKIDSIIKETKKFAVIPSIGPLVEGHILMVSKKHYPSMGALPKKLIPEMLKLKKDCQSALLKIYHKKSICFEHGVVDSNPGKKAGCCVDHLHLHIIPAEIDIIDEMKKNFRAEKINSFNQLADKFQKKTPYLFYEDNDEEKYVFNAPLVISQYLRMIVADKLGVIDRWDWKANYGEKRFLDTLQKLKGNI